MRFSLALFLSAIVVAPAAAHPLTDFRFDRTAAVRAADDGVEVIFTLETSLLSLHLDARNRLSPADIAGLDKSPRGYAAVYAKRVAPELLEKFKIDLDGVRVALDVASIDVTFTDHAICRFVLHGAWPPGERHRVLHVNDETFSDKPGVVNLTVDRKGNAKLELLDVDEPPARLRDKPQLTAEEASLARKATATLRLTSPVATPTTPHPTAATLPEPVVNADVPPAPNLLADLARRGLPALFDSSFGIGVLLLAAFLFGAAHAFTPGHGKTLVAAYLVGERGTVKHAVILALATTVAHTGSVIVVAAILWSVYGNNVPGNTQGTLQFVAGLLVLGVGLWLLLRRLTGQADHFHLFAGHHHQHEHDHLHSHHHDHGHHHHHGPPPESAKTTGGWLRIVLMGLGGGLVPCWDAVLLLVAASAMGRLGFALPLLLAFSLGLGAVLVALGVGVVYAYRAGTKRFNESRWFRLLPTVSALLLVGIGFWLCKQAVGMVAG
jgi:nickel/cobalt exporter